MDRTTPSSSKEQQSGWSSTSHCRAVTGILLLFARLRSASRTAPWSQKLGCCMALPWGTWWYGLSSALHGGGCPSFMPDPPHLSQQKVCSGGVVPTEYFRHVFLGKAALAGSGLCESRSWRQQHACGV